MNEILLPWEKYVSIGFTQWVDKGDYIVVIYPFLDPNKDLDQETVWFYKTKEKPRVLIFDNIKIYRVKRGSFVKAMAEFKSDSIVEIFEGLKNSEIEIVYQFAYIDNEEE